MCVPFEGIRGITEGNIQFISCDVCHSVSLDFGDVGQISATVFLLPSDPRAKFLCSITEEKLHEGWGKPLAHPVYVSGVVDIASVARMSEIGCSCFNCAAGP